MIPTIKAEFKKLLTVRSTYYLVLIALLLTAFFTYLGTAPIVYEEPVVAETTNQQTTEPTSESKPAVPGDPSQPEVTIVTSVSKDLPKEKLVINFQDMMPVVTVFFAIAVVLLMAHEFRHNTITYTLTASNSRSKVLASKIIVAITFTFLASLLAIGVTMIATFAAIQLKDLNLPQQDYNWGYIFVRLIGYALSFTLIMLAIITLFRNIVAGIVAIFVLPLIDSIVGALIASRGIEATKVLPFSALNRIGSVANDLMYTQNVPVEQMGANVTTVQATVLGASLVVLVYLLGLWAAAWILFLRRDAS